MAEVREEPSPIQGRWQKCCWASCAWSTEPRAVGHRATTTLCHHHPVPPPPCATTMLCHHHAISGTILLCSLSPPRVNSCTAGGSSSPALPPLSMRSTQPFPACSHIVHPADRGHIATIRAEPQVRHRRAALHCAQLPARDGCWGGQCRGAGCPEPPPGHTAASPSSFCCQKPAAEGFSHSRLSTPEGWGPWWQFAPVTCGCVIPLCSILQHSCSGGAPGSGGQCCRAHVGLAGCGLQEPCGELRSLQELFHRDPEQPRPLCQDLPALGSGDPAATQVGSSSHPSCSTLCLQDSAPEADPFTLSALPCSCSVPPNPHLLPSVLERGALQRLWCSGMSWELQIPVSECSRPDSTATPWLFSCLSSLGSFSSIQNCFSSQLVSSPASLAFPDLPP